MTKFFSFSHNDDKFVESACVSHKRRFKIEQLEILRKYFPIMLGAHFISCVLLLVLLLVSRHSEGITGGIAFFAMYFSIFVHGLSVLNHIDTQIKMLKTFEKMESLSRADGE